MGDRENRVRFGDFVFDPRSGELWRGEVGHQLPPQPSRLLALLVRRAGDVVSRDEAYRAIWPDEAFVDREHGLNHCVRQLRRALDDDARAPSFIETLPRRGYRFLPKVTSCASARETPPVSTVGRWRSARRIAVAVAVTVASATLFVALSVLLEGRPDHRRSGLDTTTTSATTSIGGAANEHYLRGRFLAARESPTDLRRAIDHYRSALAADPDLTAASVGLAAAYIDATEAGILPAPAGFDLAHSAASSALARSADSAEAHLTRGIAALYRDLDWEAARRDFARATRLDPDHAIAHLWLARSQAAAGEHDRAIATVTTARVLDPASEIIVADLGWFHVLARRFDKAVITCEQAIDLAPDSVAASGCLLAARRALGDPAAAVEAARHWLISFGADPEMRARADRAFEREGTDAFWRVAAGWLEGACAMGGLSIHTAAIHLELGDVDTALEQLEHAVAIRLPWVPFLAIDPAFAALRGHPRFERLVAGLDA